MKIAVLIKQVPESSEVKIDERTGTVVRTGTENVVNPLDYYAVELALELKRKYGAEIAAFSMGPAGAETALREVMALGIDSGYLVTDRAFAGSDTWATSRILAAAVTFAGSADLIVCGERAVDGDTGQVGSECAAALGFPVATYVKKVLGVRDGVLTAVRADGYGAETLEIRLPALISVLKEIASPSLPTLDGKIRAKAAPITILTQKELNLPPESVGLAGSPTRVVGIFHPKVGRLCRMTAPHDGDLAPCMAEFSAFLREKKML